ncbi:hypothetical protein BDY21DRAFT_331592 [Lineolata rhizophorae]|uniref:Uncharacterized protein n=1 Tax=Lineolata rhizophorae TaxID=578093 RepID=A0A6A6PBH3_9PEZI|nr:hypothetical protein BDY21DRAFT_331592 [Lineolata rhizophorae]
MERDTLNEAGAAVAALLLPSAVGGEAAAAAGGGFSSFAGAGAGAGAGAEAAGFGSSFSSARAPAAAAPAAPGALGTGVSPRQLSALNRPTSPLPGLRVASGACSSASAWRQSRERKTAGNDCKCRPTSSPDIFRLGKTRSSKTAADLDRGSIGAPNRPVRPHLRRASRSREKPGR